MTGNDENYCGTPFFFSKHWIFLFKLINEKNSGYPQYFSFSGG